VVLFVGGGGGGGGGRERGGRGLFDHLGVHCIFFIFLDCECDHISLFLRMDVFFFLLAWLLYTQYKKVMLYLTNISAHFFFFPPLTSLSPPKKKNNGVAN